MKKIIIVFTVLFFTLSCWSQSVSKTIHIDVPGSLSTNLTATEKSTITDLTITGNIDARDFKTMRYNMPLLANLDLSNVTIASYTGSGGTVSLNTIYPVNELPAGAFNFNYTLVSIKLPKSIISIGEKAFYACYSLAGELIIPDNITSVGNYAYSGCFKISGALHIGKGLQSIGKYAFTTNHNSVGLYSNTDSIVVDPSNPYFTSLDGILYTKDFTKLIVCPQGKSGVLAIPNTVVEVCDNSLAHCRKLTGNLSIPGSVTTIGEYAFDDCRGFTGPLTLSDNIKTIGAYAFQNCRGLSSLTIPGFLEIINNGVFSACSSFSGDLKIPASVKSIGNCAFIDCNFNDSLIVGAGLESIHTTFYYNRGFSKIVIDPANSHFSSDGLLLFDKGKTKLFYGIINSGKLSNIPESVSVIGDSAFIGVTRLKEVILGKNITKIEDNAFSYCDSLSRFYLINPVPPSCYNLGFNPAQCTLFVPKGSKTAYQAAQYWGLCSNIIEQDYTDNTAVNELSESALSVYGRSNEIVVAGASSGQIIQVYSLTGLLLKTARTTSEMTIIPVDKGGVYLINVSGRVAKVVL